MFQDSPTISKIQSKFSSNLSKMLSNNPSSQNLKK